MRAHAAAAVCLAAILAASCGDESLRTVDVADVRGTPFRRAPAPPQTPDPSLLGDVDAPRPGDIRTPEPAAPAVAAAPTAPAPAPPARGTEKRPAAPPSAEDDAISTSFDDLSSFECAAYAADAKEKHPIPEKVQKLSGRRVVVEGYMMPVTFEAGGAKKFLLLRNQFGCCFAASPKLNEWVDVTMEGGSVAEYAQHVLVRVWGVLDVKEELRDGVTVSLYRMKATRTEFTEAQ